MMCKYLDVRNVVISGTSNVQEYIKVCASPSEMNSSMY